MAEPAENTHLLYEHERQHRYGRNCDFVGWN